MRVAAVLLSLSFVVACDDTESRSPSEVRAAALASGLAAACPMGDGGDAAARRACAEAVNGVTALRDIMGTDVLWGGHPADVASFDPSRHKLTRFDSRIYRMMYLATFMFSGDYRVEQQGDLTAIRVSATFRRDMDIGEYPYPFWHAANKWTAYLDATELIFVLKDDVLLAVYRFGSDKTQPRVEHTWDGQWTWSEGLEPRVALYSYVLSPTNPHLEPLNDAYRALEAKFRTETCTECHAPDNTEEMSPLVLLTYPNQALGDRHRLVEQLGDNAMPPDEGVAEPHRQELLDLAIEFARLGDDALAFEGEPVE